MMIPCLIDPDHGILAAPGGGSPKGWPCPRRGMASNKEIAQHLQGGQQGQGIDNVDSRFQSQ